MRKYIYKYVVVAVAAIAMVSCNEFDDPDIQFAGDNFYRFSTASSNVVENCPEATAIEVIYASRDGRGATGQVEFEIVGGTENVDYMLVGSSTLTFDSSTAFKDYIAIQPVDNNINNDNLVLEVRLVNPVDGSVGFDGPDKMNASHNLIVVNDDCAGMSFDIGGLYTAQSSGQSTDGCCPDPTSLSSTVTISTIGTNTYFINDFSGGLYLDWYDVYGITSQDQSPAVFEFDQCSGTVREQAGSTETFGSPLTMTGTYDKCTGILTYSWVNGFMDSGTITLTPQ